MSLSKPRLYEVYAFDATKDYAFKFTYTGSQAQWNRLRIVDDSDVELYNEKVTTNRSEHRVSADAFASHRIVNDKKKRYKAYITIGYSYTVETKRYEDNDGDGHYETVVPESITEEFVSEESAWVSFICFDSPIIKLGEPLQELGAPIISSSNFGFEIEHLASANQDTLNSYEVKLFNTNGQQIHTSGTVYTKGTPGPYQYEVSGLEDNQRYTIQATAETVNHLVAISPVYEFSVEYVRPSAFAALVPTNLPKEGQIKLQSNIISILGKCGPTSRTGLLSDGSPAMPIYIDNQEIDVTDDGHWVMFDEGFDINNDFTMQIILRNPNLCTDVLMMYDGVEGVSGPLISIPAEDNPNTVVIENDPMLTDVYDGKYVRDIANPPSADIIPSSGWLRGDVNNDGEINSADENLLHRYLMGGADLTNDALLSADINQDGLIDYTDVDIMHQNILYPPEWSSTELQNVITLTYMTGHFAFEVNSDDGDETNDTSYVDAPIVEKAYMALYAHGGNITYTAISDFFEIPNESDYIYVWIQRSNNLYTVKASILDGGVN